MKQTDHPAIIYDAIFYGIIYFNMPVLKEAYETLRLNYEDAFNYYYEVNNSCKPLDQCLYPVFYYDGEKSSVLISYMRKNVDFHTHTMNDFIDMILDNAKFKEHVFGCLFENIPRNEIEKLMKKDSEAIAKVFEHQTWNAKMREQTMFFVNHFPYVCDVLHKYLIEIHRHISALRKKYIAVIEQRTKEMSDKEILSLFDKHYSLSELIMEKSYFSLSFMSQFVIWSLTMGNKETESTFILGNRFKEFLLTKNKGSPTPINKYYFVLGDPIRFNVIGLLKQYGVLTLTDIARLANVSTSTAFNVLNIFNNYNVVKANHKEGRKVYYTLNIDFFALSVENHNDYVNYITSDKKGDEKDE